MNISILSIVSLVTQLLIHESTSIDEIQFEPRNLQSFASIDTIGTGKKFQIKSFLSSSTDMEWCVKADSLSRIITDECNDEDINQIWTFDEHGRMRMGNGGDCIYALEPTTPSPSTTVTQVATVLNGDLNERFIGDKLVKLSLNSCGPSEEANRFAYNSFDNTLSNVKYGFLSIIDDRPTYTVPLTLIKRDSCLIGQKWILEEIIPITQIKFAGNPCPGEDGCSICTGDCDNDDDCAEGLRCVQRESHAPLGRENVPGCSFKTPNDPERFYRNDYCFKPIELPGVVNFVGNCDASTYLCGECEGDCANDHDCTGDLKCYHRSAFEGVPGCSGEGGERDVYGKNICYNPLTEVARVRWGNRCTKGNPCGICTGNCFNDDDCKGDLRCAKRDAGIDVPGCRFKKQWLRDNVEHNYCFMPDLFPSTAGIVSYVGECSGNTYLCRRCEGNCITSDDCEGDLECRERHGFERVPGCFDASGHSDMEGKNICIDANWDKPQLRSCPWYLKSCPECTECHNDSDCEGDLRCAIRDGIEDVPGCRWGNKSTVRDFFNGTNYCFKPYNKPGILNYIGECSRGEGEYLCGECEGGCKYDIDCKPGLKCMYRSAFEEVPGCSEPGGERDMYGKGMCFNPNFIERTTSICRGG